MATWQTNASPVQPPSLLQAAQTWASTAQNRLSNGYMQSRVRVDGVLPQTGTVSIEQSDDEAFGSFDTLVSKSFTADQATRTRWVKVTKKFYRVKIVNGGAAWTAFADKLWLEVGGRPVVDVEIQGYDLPESVTLQNAAAALGDGTSMSVAGQASALFVATLTGTAVVTFEGSPDEGTTWTAIPAIRLNTGAVATTASATAQYLAPCFNMTHVRARVSSYTSGAVTVKGYPSPMVVQIPQVQITGSTVKGPGEWTVTATSGANAAATATKAAEANKKHVITGYVVVTRAAAAGNDISALVKDGAATKITDYIGSGAPRGTRVGATGLNIELSTNTAANLEAAAGGASVITELTLMGYTKDA